MSRIAAFVVLFLLVPAGVAQAGGWAAVAVDRLPEDTSAGAPVRVELRVLQHGVTPLDDVRPSVRIQNEAGVVRTFPATPTGRPGTYVAELTFPTAGRWRWQIFDGFTDAVPHIPPPVTIGPASAAAATAGGSFPWHQTVAIVLVALLWLGGVLAARDTVSPRERRHPRRRHRPAPGAVA